MIEGPYNPFPNYRFTGKIRPVYPLSPRRTVPENIPRPDYAEDGVPKSELAIRGSTTIDVLTPAEQDKMRTVCRMGREILDAAGRAVKIGVRTDEIGPFFSIFL